MTGLPFLYGGDTIEKYNKEVLQARITAERAILKDIEEQYKDALGAINSHIAQLLGRQDADLPHVIHRVEYQRVLKQQVQASLDKLHSTEYESVTEYLNESYTDAFVGTVYTLHHQDMPVILPISQALAVKAITLDTRLKKTMYEEMGKDINQLKKTIQREITRGIASGMMYSEIARNISNQAGIPMRRAKTIARTEAGRVQEQASFDAALQAMEKGADLVKQWSAVHDGKTRDAHRMLDNQIREMNEPFEIDGEKAMHPHDFGVAALDCNCRCTMLKVARTSLDADVLKKMQEDAHTHGLMVKDSKELGHAQAKNIAEFKKRYLKAAENPSNITKPLINQGKSGIMKLPDIPILRSLGAKAVNYDIKDLVTGIKYHLVEGTKLTNVEVFAGKGVSTIYRNAYKYANKHGGKLEDWQHVKGIGYVETEEGERKAELHWSQCENIGKFDFFIKRWLDE